MKTAVYQSPLGRIWLTEKDDALVALRFENQRSLLPASGEYKEEKTPLLKAAEEWLDRYFTGERPSPAELPLAPAGNDFRRLVWQVLLEIPYGEVCTYGEAAALVAARMNKQAMSARAIGGAVGSNPLPLIIPCHRVVGANGNLVGYSAGIQKKVFLLAHEGIDLSGFFTPFSR